MLKFFVGRTDPGQKHPSRGVLETNFSKFTWKQLHRSLFLIKQQAVYLQSYEKEALDSYFPINMTKIFRTTLANFFTFFTFFTFFQRFLPKTSFPPPLKPENTDCLLKIIMTYHTLVCTLRQIYI